MPMRGRTVTNIAKNRMVTISETLRWWLRSSPRPIFGSRRRIWSAIAVAASFLFLTAGRGAAVEQATAGGTQAQATAPSAGIAGTEGPTRPTGGANLIRNFPAKVASNAGIKALKGYVPNNAKAIELEASTT